MHFEISDQGIFREIDKAYLCEWLSAAHLAVAVSLRSFFLLASSCNILLMSYTHSHPEENLPYFNCAVGAFFKL